MIGKSFGPSASVKSAAGSGQKPPFRLQPRPLLSTAPKAVKVSKGKSAVAGGQAKHLSVGKGLSNANGVSLGTTYGRHDVAHRISGQKNQGPGQVPRGNVF